MSIFTKNGLHFKRLTEWHYISECGRFEIIYNDELEGEEPCWSLFLDHEHEDDAPTKKELLEIANDIWKVI